MDGESKMEKQRDSERRDREGESRRPGANELGFGWERGVKPTSAYIHLVPNSESNG
jgi:hypothetical protein